jgi:hypothetical protein
MIQTIRDFLRGREWAEPILADSGNGYHLLFPIDLPADDGGLVKRVLEGLAVKFDSELVKIDKKVFNAARICKLPGTIARKGDPTETRKHRRARLLEVPVDPAAIVTREQLVALADELAPPSTTKQTASSNGKFTSRLKVGEWLTDRGVKHRIKAEPEDKGRTVFVLDCCPFNDAHGVDSCVMQAADGQMSANCFHDGCADKDWQAFKEKIGKPEAHHFDPPMGGKRKKAPRPTFGTSGTPGPGAPAGEGAKHPSSGEPSDPTSASEATPTIVVEPSKDRVGATMGKITDVLLAAGNCYRRADQLVRIVGGTITPVLSAPELAGLLNAHAEIFHVGDKTSEFRPLPTPYANTWLYHPGQAARFPVIHLFTLNPVFTRDWTLTPAGYDPASGIYYAGEAVEPCTGTAHLDALLRDFCFKTPGDRTNYVGMLLTAILMPHFVGSKPAVIFNGNQPGLGKTVLAQIIATLRDGRPTETASYNPNDEEFEKRLGAIVRRGSTTILIDNAKARGRTTRIDSPCLERSITDAVLSFRLLGHSKEIRAENSHIFCITANGPDVSRDLITRSVVVNLEYEGDPAKRTFTIPDPEGYAQEHRIDLLGELIGMVKIWRAAGSPLGDALSRFNKKGWGPIVGGILTVNGLPDFLANAQEAAESLDDTRRDFAHLVALMVEHEQGHWTATELSAFADANKLFPDSLKDATPRAQATRFGLIAGRYLNEAFPLADGRTATFRRTADRKGHLYRVDVPEEATFL